MSTSNIVQSLVDITTQSRVELTEVISNVLGDRLIRVIDSHNTQSIIFILQGEGGKQLIKAEIGNNTATHREITWYKLLQQKNLASPSVDFVTSYATDNHAFLILEYVDSSLTIDEAVMSGHAASDVIRSHIKRAIAADERLFNATKISASSEQVDIFYMGKYRQRRREVKQHAYLEELFSQSHIVVNGQQYETPDVILERINSSKEILSLLTPTELGLIHGDLHCGNILMRNKEFFFIDPNGNPALPFEYDIGKLLHSIHGNYGAIMLSNYELLEESPYAYSFLHSIPKPYLAAFNEVQKALGDDLLIRGLYMEALHFATMLPHHAANEKETTALFLRCVQLFDELMTFIRSR